MRHEPDEDGRYPLSTREYDALRTVFGAVNALDIDTLKDRCGLIKNGWRDIRLAHSLLKRVMQELLCTVPAKKLMTIRTELKHTVCELKVKPPSSMSLGGSVYVDHQALVKLAERAISMDCLFCDKDAKQGKRCPLYKALNACFPYELCEPTDEKCPFAGVSRLTLED